MTCIAWQSRRFSGGRTLGAISWGSEPWRSTHAYPDRMSQAKFGDGLEAALRGDCESPSTISVMDAYEGPATVTDGREHLGSVHVDVVWQRDRWWGVMISERDSVAWVGHPLVLCIDDHPEASFAISNMGTQSGTGHWTSHFEGSGVPPFWGARSSGELIAELRRRKPAASSLMPGVEPPSYPAPDTIAEELRTILTERDGLTDEEIDIDRGRS